jgi:hypothetical protein
MAKPKKVPYILVEGNSIPLMAKRLIEDHHHHLVNANFAFAWNRTWKEDADGILVFGKAKKVSEPERTMMGIDFLVLLNGAAWANMAEEAQIALLDHELTHCAICEDDDGEPKRDEKERICYRMRKHDFQEFAEVAARHKKATPGLVAFARAAQLELWSTVA